MMRNLHGLQVVLSGLLGLLMSAPLFADQSLREFHRDDYQVIVEAHEQQAFLLVMWSLDCPPCRQELDMLGEFYRHNPGLKLVLISTDSITQSEDIAAVMQQAGLQQAEQWVFADEPGAALRYAIDPGWYGELPRSYFHRPAQPRNAMSGRLSLSQLTRWYIASAEDTD